MSRRHSATKRPLAKDGKYQNTLVARLVNTVMFSGKKSTAQRIVYAAFDTISEKNPASNPIEILQRAVDNAKPRLEVKPRRVGGATYQVPVEASTDRGLSLALRWVVDFADSRKGVPMDRIDRRCSPRKQRTLKALAGVWPQRLVLLATLFCAAASHAAPITAGWGHNLIVRDDGSLWAWGANGEGQLVDILQSWRGTVDGVVVNAGAYTHTSLALADAFTATSLPFVEIHISNVYAREPVRHHSMLASTAIGTICGLGVNGYEFALRGLIAALRARN